MIIKFKETKAWREYQDKQEMRLFVNGEYKARLRKSDILAYFQSKIEETEEPFNWTMISDFDNYVLRIDGVKYHAKR